MSAAPIQEQYLKGSAACRTHKGTLFLDEMGELPLELQAKLLRALEEQEFQRLGSSRTIHVDVRFVAATNQQLAEMVNKRLFRADLYYRLNVFPITSPPLRDRKDDIPALTGHFVEEYSRRMNKIIDDIPPQVMEALIRYDWPGNIRELQNVVERAVVVSPGRQLRPALDEFVGLRSSVAMRAVKMPARRSDLSCTLEENGAASHLPDAGEDQMAGRRTRRRGGETRVASDYFDVPNAEVGDFAACGGNTSLCPGYPVLGASPETRWPKLLWGQSM